jgi:hypothetical protein
MTTEEAQNDREWRVRGNNSIVRYKGVPGLLQPKSRLTSTMFLPDALLMKG